MRIIIHGIVQGVGFRPTVHRVATALGAHGYVQNNGSNVVIEVDVDPDRFMTELRRALPPLARLDRVEILPGLDDEKLRGMGFRIVKSESGEKGVAIPNDYAICNRCQQEMFDPQDRRFRYPFTNCTDCGARFTIISDLPYDREKTAMRAFPMCEDCMREYEDPEHRRFHHQTISCPRCGPKYYLLGPKGERLEGDPVEGFARAIQAGKVGVVKSWGGMHICCSLDHLEDMRRWYRRKEKPFAIMVRDMEALERYGAPNEVERSLLLSGHRPIVLVEKVRSEITELISPGLDNIGLFLPYTEMQQLLFAQLQVDALVMTSANVPGEPMVLRDEEALGLGADIYLLHDREIFNRCDDSVVREYHGSTFFVRKSRGYVPSSLAIPFTGTAIALGAQENIVGALAYKRMLHSTQYIGDSSSAGVLEFLETAIGYLRRLLGVEKVESIGVDLHPGYSTRRLGKRLAEEWEAELVPVQHHWAHAAALQLEHGLDHLVVITIDGTGYGEDGKAWGGEVLDSRFDRYERVGHLEELPLLGGEKAVYDVRRLVYAAQRKLGREGWYYQGEERAVLDKMLSKSTSSTGLGRVLDAVACALDICRYRSYDGEPAMKLEPYLKNSKVDRSKSYTMEGNIIKSVEMFASVLDAQGDKDVIASTYVHSILEGLVDLAAERAREHGQDRIGVTGGVSYNHAITQWIEDLAAERGLRLVVPNQLPNGDGCISAGQCAIALKRCS